MITTIEISIATNLSGKSRDTMSPIPNDKAIAPGCLK